MSEATIRPFPSPEGGLGLPILSCVNPQVTAIVVAAIGTFGALGAAILQAWRGRGSSWQATVREELELLKQLPEGEAHTRLQTYIEHKVIERTEAAVAGRRDPSGMALGSIFVILAAIIGVPAIALGGWWYFLLILALPLFIFGLVGFIESFAKVERDEKGVRIPSAPSAVATTDPVPESGEPS